MKFIFASLLLGFSVVGCSTSPKPTYYTLSSPAIPVEQKSNKLRVMVGPIALPDALDQPRLVVQTNGTEVKLHDYHRWAGSLKNDIARVVGARLAIDLGISNVWSFSQSTQTDFDYQVLINVQSLESKQDDRVLLDMLWTVRPKDPKKEPMMGRSVVRETVSGSNIESIVAAQSRAFALASADIAKAIRQYGSTNSIH
jgi:hypothetical protein